MTTKKHQLESYRKCLLNRLSASPQITEYIENCLSTEDEIAKYTFHKIMVHNWTESETRLFDILSDYYSPNFIPVSYVSQGDIASFYTSSLSLVLKITKLDFLFPHQRNMYNIDILFNDKSSVDCFDNQITIDDIVTGVVSRRFSDKFELDLSNFCSDPEFTDKKIHFYKIALLSNFKLLMLRMGRDTKLLNLSNNNLSVIPAEILNFFIKGDLVAVNLSDNNIPSIAELQRVSSKIEKLWIEGNPLCKDLDPVTYVKSIVIKFPRLIELDGVTLNEHGVMLPFYKNFLATPDTGTKMIVEKFLSLYFTHYDSYPRKKISMFYDINAVLTLATNFTDAEEQLMPVYANHSRNILHPSKKRFVVLGNKLYRGRNSVAGVLYQFPQSTHDPSRFTVDVIKHDNQSLMLIVDGVYKETAKDDTQPELFFQFRRTFNFQVQHKNNTTKEYFIVNEIFNVSFATKELINASFKNSARTMNPLALQNPDSEDIETIVKIFTHLSRLNGSEAERRLKKHNWAIFKAMKELLQDIRSGKVPSDLFTEEDDFSDSSSLVDDEMD